MSDSGQSLKVGFGLPDSEYMLDGVTARWTDLSDMARHAEQAGFDSLWIQDHLLFRFPDKESEAPWESFSLLAALAAVTERAEIGTLVTCTSFRNPALTAKIADTIDEISGGRLILGLGAGWHEPEYDAFGYPFDHRVSRFAEALTIIHGLLHDGQIDFDGTYYQARDCELRPRGPRPNGPPIMIGSTSPRMLRLTALYADLWNAYFSRTGNRASGVAEPRALVDAACADAGRDPATLERTITVYVDFTGNVSGQSSVNPTGVPALTGSTEEIASELLAYPAEGISHVQIYMEPNTRTSIDRFAPVLEAVRKGG